MRDTERARLIREADAIMSARVRSEHPRCQNCGKPTTDAAHGEGRAHYSTRWLRTNLFGLCRECHEWFGRRRTTWRHWRLVRIGALLEGIEEWAKRPFAEIHGVPMVVWLREFVRREHAGRIAA